MTREIKKYLFDISAAADHVYRIHLPQANTLELFEVNLTIQRAVERELGIIGEAAWQLQKRNFIFEGQDQLINRRNTLVHQYGATSPRQLWNYIQSDLVLLRERIDQLLNEQ